MNWETHTLAIGFHVTPPLPQSRSWGRVLGFDCNVSLVFPTLPPRDDRETEEEVGRATIGLKNFAMMAGIGIGYF